MKSLFASGCALRNYKPHHVRRMTEFLKSAGLIDGTYEICCKERPQSDEELTLIDCCPGCSHKFEAFPHVTVISLWQVLLDTNFPFPDYNGRVMTIHDACPVRSRNSSEMQQSVRALCRKMNITLEEPEWTRDNTPCCGGCSGEYEVRKKMANLRALQLPRKDVVLYCTGCIRSFSLTDAVPHHLMDLLYEEPTEGLTVKR